MADAGHYSDCCRRRWLGPRARPRITQGLGKEGLLPHTPEAGVRKLPTQACQNCPPAVQHARTQACYFIPGPLSLWEQLAGPPGPSGGGDWGRGWRPCPTWARCFSSCLCARAVGLWALSPLRNQAGSGFLGTKPRNPLLDAWPCGQRCRYQVIYGVLLILASCYASGWGVVP